MSLAAVGVELCEAAPVKILKIRVSARQRQVNVIEHARIVCARLVRSAGHQAFGERGDGDGIVMIEEGAMLGAAGMHVR